MIPTRMNPMGLSPYRRRLSYLESTGTQYIDTGYKPVEDSKIDVYASYGVDQTGNASVFGVRASTAHIGWVSRDNTRAYIQFAAAPQTTDAYNISADFTDKVHIELMKTGGYVNGTQVYTPAYTTQGLSSTVNLYIYAQNNEGEGPYNIGNIRVYSFRIFEGNTLVRDMIPVLDNSGVPCLYDTITKTFFYNAGTGTFNYA